MSKLLEFTMPESEDEPIFIDPRNILRIHHIGVRPEQKTNESIPDVVTQITFHSGDIVFVREDCRKVASIVNELRE